MKTSPIPTCIMIVVAIAFMMELVACDNHELVDPQLSYQLESTARDGLVGSWQGPGALTVMTRNVYVGANVDLVLAAAPEDVPVVVAQVFQQMIATNFAERADAFAREIAAARPHLVGLQEISLIRIQSPGDVAIGGATPAEDVFIDQQEILLNALAAIGESYYVVGAVENLDVEVPMLTGLDPLSFDDVRLTDFDVLLARSDVATSNVVTRNFAAAVPVPGIGQLTRGYVAADASVHGRTFRVITSHLEPVWIPDILPVQLGQVAELTAAIDGLNMPAVVIGDLNTGPGRPGYEALIGSGLIDLWNHRSGSRSGSGFTCCFPDDLRGNSRTPDERIDLVLYRSPSATHGNNGLGAVSVDLVGEEETDITETGLWPSDHVGVVAWLRAPEAAWKY